MCAISIESQVDNVVFDTFPQFIFFLRHIDHFNQALHGVSAFLITRDIQNVRLKHFENLVALFGAGALEQFLAEIVAVLVGHQLVDVVRHLFNGELHEVW